MRKSKNLLDSFNNAINGIIHTIKSERNMKIHILAAVTILVASLLFQLSRLEFLIVCFTVGIVIICELFNTAIEVLVDIIVDIYHPKARIIKDAAAGAVLVSACIAVTVAYFIFFDRVSSVLERGIIGIRRAPIHITVVSLAITALLVLVLKAFTRIGTPFSGGMPSGHSAIAFSVTTAIALWTDNANIVLLCLILSLLVVQSRLEGKIHNLFELAAGAALGFLTTLLLFQVFY